MLSVSVMLLFSALTFIHISFFIFLPQVIIYREVLVQLVEEPSRVNSFTSTGLRVVNHPYSKQDVKSCENVSKSGAVVQPVSLLT